ncbi:hypothetical protein SAMN05421770_102278 [Granulicella rosea]|uniref:Uncharacterized protein n=1 Tax=Granulicella rosea TaxID=474952 RepID=A0A239H8H1_9BACT|nr:hypothetical protein [Granulicella rosea]SNS77660.1 hypothetical protein SAMN05421770_102278 [Granulicella rosea]
MNTLASREILKYYAFLVKRLSNGPVKEIRKANAVRGTLLMAVGMLAHSASVSSLCLINRAHVTFLRVTESSR